MSALHYINAFLWAVNAVLWFTYAHVAAMGVCSIGAALLSVGMARSFRD